MKEFILSIVSVCKMYPTFGSALFGLVLLGMSTVVFWAVEWLCRKLQEWNFRRNAAKEALERRKGPHKSKREFAEWYEVPPMS